MEEYKLNKDFRESNEPISDSDIIPWTRDLVGDIFVVDLKQYYESRAYKGAEQLHIGGSGFGSQKGKTGSKIFCYDILNGCSETIHRQTVLGLLSYEKVFEYFEDPRSSATIDGICDVIAMLNNTEYRCPSSWNQLISDLKESVLHVGDRNFTIEEATSVKEIADRLKCDCKEIYESISAYISSDKIGESLGATNLSVELENQLYWDKAHEQKLDGDFEVTNADKVNALTECEDYIHKQVMYLIFREVKDEVLDEALIKVGLELTSASRLNILDKNLLNQLLRVRHYLYRGVVLSESQLPELKLETILCVLQADNYLRRTAGTVASYTDVIKYLGLMDKLGLEPCLSENHEMGLKFLDKIKIVKSDDWMCSGSSRAGLAKIIVWKRDSLMSMYDIGNDEMQNNIECMLLCSMRLINEGRERNTLNITEIQNLLEYLRDMNYFFKGITTEAFIETEQILLDLINKYKDFEFKNYNYGIYLKTDTNKTESKMGTISANPLD